MARPLVAGVLGLALLLAWLPASASAAQSTYVEIGPIKLHSGWSVTLTDTACGAKKASDFGVSFTKGNSTDYAEHAYVSKAVPECRVSKTLSTASVNVKWAKVLDLSVKLSKPGALRKGGTVPVGCSGRFGEQRAGTAQGTIDVGIHASGLGKLAAKSAPAYISTSGSISCKAPKATKAYNLDASFTKPAAFLAASEQTNGRNPYVFITNDTADTPAKDVTGSYLLSLGGRSSVAIKAPNATVYGLKGFTTGELQFAGLPACTSTPNAYNGSFKGTLTVLDPVFGNFALTGASAQYPSLVLNSAQPGTCNGPLYQPVSPLLDNECSTAGICSVSQNFSTVTFNDGTNAGSNTITSESINFGDGSAPQPITPGGSITHTYAKAGTYTATLTVTYTVKDSSSPPQTATASSPVDIGS